MTSDWELLNKAPTGSHNAWNQLFDRYSSQLIQLGTMISGSSEIGKDVVQETFYRLLNSTEKHQSGNFNSYITKIAFRQALKAKETKADYHEGDLGQVESDGLSPLEAFLKSDREMLIAKTLNSLESKHSDVLVLRFFNGLEYAEIAEVLSKS